METFSSVVMAIVFLFGASVGALFTAAFRYASRNVIQRDFQKRLVVMVEQQEMGHFSERPVGSSPSSRANEDEFLLEDLEEVENEEDLAWIAAHTAVTRSDGLNV